MRRQHSQPTDSEVDSDASSTADMPRRDFLQVGAAGLASVVATPVSPSGDAPSAPRQEQQARPSPQFLRGRPDPTAIPAETWLEPWCWRPIDWPDAALDLNVIRHQNPGPAPSRGSLSPSLFSFG